MDLVVYSQYYRAVTPERQLEIDECLRRNLNPARISRVAHLWERDAPPLPQGRVPVQVVTSNERLTYAEWFRWVKRQDFDIGLLLAADIDLDEGLAHLTAICNGPGAFFVLTRYDPGHARFHPNAYPHRMQVTWGMRAVTETPLTTCLTCKEGLNFSTNTSMSSNTITGRRKPESSSLCSRHPRGTLEPC